MGPLVAVGGIRVPGDKLRGLEIALDQLCAKAKFPPNEEFKWSPGRKDWMREGLVEQSRTEFFLDALAIARDAGAKAIVVMEDTRKAMARQDSATHRDDVTMLFLERAQGDLRKDECALVVFDRPGGRPKDDTQFLTDAIAKIRTGTAYTKLEGLTLVLSTDSKHARVLQLADVVVACYTSYVGGESNWSPPVFTRGVLPMLREESGYRGGRGLKIHPDFRYGNLYHWLLGDTHIWRGSIGHPLPAKRLTAYHQSADVA